MSEDKQDKQLHHSSSPSTPTRKLTTLTWSTPESENYKPYQSSKCWELGWKRPLSPKTKAWERKVRANSGCTFRQRQKQASGNVPLNHTEVYSLTCCAAAVVPTSDGEEEELELPAEKLFKPKYKAPIEDPNACFLLWKYARRVQALEELLRRNGIEIPSDLQQEITFEKLAEVDVVVSGLRK